MGSSAALPDTTSWTEREDKGVCLGTNVVGLIEQKPIGPMHTGDSTRCVVCGVETQPNKPEGNYEQYIVTDEIWRAAGMPPGQIDPKTWVLKGGGGCLCVGCLERRLGRQLTNADFMHQEQLWSSRDHGWLTPRLVGRLSTGMTDPRPIPEPLMNAVRRTKRLRQAKSGEINGNDVYILLSKPGRKPYAMHFVIGPQGKATIDTCYSDYAKFMKMVHDGTASFDLKVPPEDDDEAAH